MTGTRQSHAQAATHVRFGVVRPQYQRHPIAIAGTQCQHKPATAYDRVPQFRDVRNKYITGTPPASTTLQISKLARADALLEVEAIAVVAVR